MANLVEMVEQESIVQAPQDSHATPWGRLLVKNTFFDVLDTDLEDQPCLFRSKTSPPGLVLKLPLADELERAADASTDDGSDVCADDDICSNASVGDDGEASDDDVSSEVSTNDSAETRSNDSAETRSNDSVETQSNDSVETRLTGCARSDNGGGEEGSCTITTKQGITLRRRRRLPSIKVAVPSLPPNEASCRLRDHVDFYSKGDCKDDGGFPEIKIKKQNRNQQEAHRITIRNFTCADTCSTSSRPTEESLSRNRSDVSSLCGISDGENQDKSTPYPTSNR